MVHFPHTELRQVLHKAVVLLQCFEVLHVINFYGGLLISSRFLCVTAALQRIIALSYAHTFFNHVLYKHVTVCFFVHRPKCLCISKTL